MGLLNWLRDSLAGPSPCNKRLPFEPDPLGPPTKPTGGRLIYGDRDPGPAEMPSDELMERWKSIASHEWLHSDGGPPVSHRVALLAIAWARQQQAQSLQIPPPGAEPVATDEELAYVWFPFRTYKDAHRAVYNSGRADERTAILRALGVEP